jgi:3-oxoacyl-[acyl-carrier protein] reductase
MRQVHMLGWREQVAVVTGAGRGIGRAIARRLAQEGAAVCVNYTSSREAAEALVREIVQAGGRAIACAADVADAAQVQRMLERTAAELGAVTILVNNAGVFVPGTLESFDAAAVERMRRINVEGLIHATRAAAGPMRERRYGRIVNLSSVAGTGTALAGSTFYAATKAEVSLLTRRFAYELGPHGITVNAVAPGFVRTDMATDFLQPGTDAEQRVASLSMVGRIGEPQDIAHAVAYLAAPDAGWITAQVLTVDGGRKDYIAHA